MDSCIPDGCGCHFFLSDNLREKRSVPLTKQSSGECFKTSCAPDRKSLLQGNHCYITNHAPLGGHVDSAAPVPVCAFSDKCVFLCFLSGDELPAKVPEPAQLGSGPSPAVHLWGWGQVASRAERPPGRHLWNGNENKMTGRSMKPDDNNSDNSSLV